MTESLRMRLDGSRQERTGSVCTCSYVPRELLESFGLGASWVPIEGTVAEESKGEQKSSATVCSWCKSILSYDDFGLVVGASTCDQMRRSLDLMANEGKQTLIIDMPATRTDESREFFHTEMVWLKDRLEEQLGKQFNPESLLSVIKARNNIRVRLRELRHNLRGSQFSALVQLESRLSPIDMLTLLDGLAVDNVIRADAKRLMICGSPLTPGDIKFLEMIEKAGAEIVADATCTGDRRIDFEIKEDGDPLRNLSQAYFDRPPCIRARPNDEFFDYTKDIIQKRNVDAVIWRTVRFCDLWSSEFQRAQKILDLPMLNLDMTYSDTNSSRVAVRVEAFLENL
jgi:benzoyl-CoA reductase/2-hydroxyglutaryl-CoA dehydratase subunit BcrC/BadD/HgdB